MNLTRSLLLRKEDPVLPTTIATASANENDQPTKSTHILARFYKEALPTCDWFSTTDPTTGQEIDIAESFCPTTRSNFMFKLFASFVTIGTFIHSWMDSDRPAFFMAYLTNWGLLVSCFYFILSLYNSVEPERNPPPSKPVSKRIRMTWILFTIASHAEVVLSILYWFLVYNPGKTILNYQTIAKHGLIAIFVCIDGLLTNRIPIRIAHWYVAALPFELAFVIWSLIHAALFPDEEALYDVLNWNKHWKTALMYTSISMLPLGVIVYCLLWTVSLHNRHYVSKFR